MRLFKSKLERILRAPPAERAEALAFVQVRLKNAHEAEALIDALRTITAFPGPDRWGADEQGYRDLHGLLAGFQNTTAPAARRHLDRHAGDELCRICDLGLQRTDPHAELLVFALRQLLIANAPGAADRIVAAMHDPRFSGRFWHWTLSAAEDQSPALVHALVTRLADPLPPDRAGAEFLAFANGLMEDGVLDAHPFDTPHGHARLTALAGWDDGDGPEYAREVAKALRHLAPDAPHAAEAREAIELALEANADWDVRLESDRARAERGDDAALGRLLAAVGDARIGWYARELIEGLGQTAAIPADANTPEHRALETMCRWLSNPAEFGKPPDEAEVVDHRRIYWPPTLDEREVWCVRYRYEPASAEDVADDLDDADESDADAPDDGYGMVGSVTFALFGVTTIDKTPEQVYGLHCCWELRQNDDPRAPEDYDGDLGWRMITAGPS